MTWYMYTATQALHNTRKLFALTTYLSGLRLQNKMHIATSKQR